MRSRLQENHPDSPFIYETLSTELIRGNRLAEARACLDRWLRRQPNDYQAHVLRGWVLEHERLDYWSAARDFAEALRQDPQRDELRLHLAELLIETNQLSPALEQVQLLRQCQPDNPTVLVQLAHIKRSQGKFEEAGKLLDQALAREPHHPLGLSERGILALQSQQPALAERFLRQALEANPTHRPTLYNLQICLDLQGKKKEARELRERLAQREAELKRLSPLTREVLDKPEDPELRYQVGMIFLRNGHTEDGLRWLGTALRRNPSHGPTHQALADYYQHAGDLDRAAWHRRFR